MSVLERAQVVQESWKITVVTNIFTIILTTWTLILKVDTSCARWELLFLQQELLGREQKIKCVCMNGQKVRLNTQKSGFAICLGDSCCTEKMDYYLIDFRTIESAGQYLFLTFGFDNRMRK